MVARFNWSIQWSASTGTGSEGRRLPGGTCLLWSKTLGKGKSLGSLDPRVCARQWSNCCIGSVYGPAALADVSWFSRSLIPFESLDVPCFLVGDYNWRPCYDNLMLSLLGGLPLTRPSLSLVPVAVPRVRFGLLVGVVLVSLASCLLFLAFLTIVLPFGLFLLYNLSIPILVAFVAVPNFCLLAKPLPMILCP